MIGDLELYHSGDNFQIGMIQGMDVWCKHAALSEQLALKRDRNQRDMHWIQIKFNYFSVFRR